MVHISKKKIDLKGNERKIIKTVCQKVLELEGILHDVDVYITLTNNEEIHKINKQYRDVDRPTDVLSFPMYDRSEIPTLKQPKKDDVEETIGDIIVSIPKVIEQSQEYGHSYERELAYLVTHGMLHLLGYDHMIDEEKAVMRAHEEAVLNELKIVRE